MKTKMKAFTLHGIGTTYFTSENMEKEILRLGESQDEIDVFIEKINSGLLKASTEKHSLIMEIGKNNYREKLRIFDFYDVMDDFKNVTKEALSFLNKILFLFEAFGGEVCSTRPFGRYHTEVWNNNFRVSLEMKGLCYDPVNTTMFNMIIRPLITNFNTMFYGGKDKPLDESITSIMVTYQAMLNINMFEQEEHKRQGEEAAEKMDQYMQRQIEAIS